MDLFDKKGSLENKNSEEEPFEKGEITDSKILESIMKNSQDTIYFKDNQSRFVANSRTHAIQFGYDDPKEMVGKSDFDFFSEAFAQAAFEDEKKILETGKPIIGKVEKFVSRDGKSSWFSASKYPIYSDTGEIIGTWGITRDITSIIVAHEELAMLNEQLEQANLKLQKLSDMDGLSELYNQRKFKETLSETIARYQQKKTKTGSTFCLLLIDIDEFKSINDKYGHPVGDKAIRFLANIIRENMRDRDLCFRCGGDEFAIILGDTDLDDGYCMAERLRKRIEESYLSCENVAIKITASIGIEKYYREESLEILLEKVDNKLYLSKTNGKNQVS